MSDAVLIALLVFAGSVTASLPPLALAWINGKQRREEKLEDWKRQDEVAARDERVADVLKSTNTRIAESAAETGAKLTVIHDLVNSDMTTTMQAQLIALKGQAALMVRLLAAKKQPVTEDEKATLKSLEAQVEALKLLVETRLVQQKVIDKGISRADKTLKRKK